MGASRGVLKVLFLVLCLLGVSTGSASAANFSLDINNALLDLGNIHGVKAIESTETPPDPAATLKGTLTGNQVKIPRANFVFPTKTTEVTKGLEAVIDLEANRDITGTFDSKTGEVTLGFNLKATVVALGQTCVIDPIQVTISSQYGKPYLGVPFTDGTLGKGALGGSWQDLPVPVGGPVCQIVSSLINGPGGIWMSHDLPDALKCTDNPAHPGCDESNPCANGPTSECCASKPDFQPCRGDEGKPKLSLSIKPKLKKASAGKAVSFKVKVKNSGDATAGGVKVCATAPRSKARVPKCQSGQIPAGKTLTRTFKVKLKQKATGTVKVSFRLTAAGIAPKKVKAKIKVLPAG